MFQMSRGQWFPFNSLHSRYLCNSSANRDQDLWAGVQALELQARTDLAGLNFTRYGTQVFDCSS